MWYILTEMGRIIENVNKLADNIPSFLIKAVRVIKNAAEKGGEKIVDERGIEK